MNNSIWFKSFSIQDLHNIGVNTMVEHLDISITEIGSDFLTAKMPVTNKTVQPVRILHGGASVALAETLGSLAAIMTIDLEKYTAVGLEINANHIRPVMEGGAVTGMAKPLHIGKKTQVWEIKIKDIKSEKLVCISRLTVSILPKI
jgi:1,4-dihydroxy-2-naphthoyl-CoA hydrolase